MGFRDRLKRRLGKGPTREGSPSDRELPRPAGPIRSRIDFAEEREAVATPSSAPPTTDPDRTPSSQEPPDPEAEIRFDAHPVQHPVKVTDPEAGQTLEFTVAPGESVLDAAERAGLELPSSCRAGGCLTCAGRVLSGQVELDEQFVLDTEHLDAGFVLLCGTRIDGPAEFLSHQQEAID